MSDELIYTSAARGLRPGTSGFCTVAATVSLGPAWVQRLEGLSGYKPLFPIGDPRASQNPVAFAHTRLSVAGQTRSVLTRAAFSGADHTGRSNKLVHHLLPADSERGTGGPAGALRQPSLMVETWTDEPRIWPAGRSLSSPPSPAAPAGYWERITGDAGWAASLARYTLDDPNAIVYVVYPLGTDVLALFDESLRLLPEPKRWAVTFNTYLTEPPAGVPCNWRGVVAGTTAMAMVKGNVIDLGSLHGTPPSDSLTEAARTGHAVQVEVKASGRISSANLSYIESPLVANSSPYKISDASQDISHSKNRAAIPSNVQIATRATGKTSKIILAIVLPTFLLVFGGVAATVVTLRANGPDKSRIQSDSGGRAQDTSQKSSASTMPARQTEVSVDNSLQERKLLDGVPTTQGGMKSEITSVAAPVLRPTDNKKLIAEDNGIANRNNNPSVVAKSSTVIGQATTVPSSQPTLIDNHTAAKRDGPATEPSISVRPFAGTSGKLSNAAIENSIKNPVCLMLHSPPVPASTYIWNVDQSPQVYISNRDISVTSVAFNPYFDNDFKAQQIEHPLQGILRVVFTRKILPGPAAKQLDLQPFVFAVDVSGSQLQSNFKSAFAEYEKTAHDKARDKEMKPFLVIDLDAALQVLKETVNKLEFKAATQGQGFCLIKLSIAAPTDFSATENK